MMSIKIPAVERVRAMRRGFGAIAVAVAGAVLTACGASLPASSPAPASPSVSGGGRTPSTQPLSTAPASAAATGGGVCTAASAAPAGDGITALGATLADWNAHHDADPDHPGWYLPAATDAPDRYTKVRCSAGGRVTAYVMTFKPPIQGDTVDAAVRGELPADAAREAVHSGTVCEWRSYMSGRLAAAFGSDDPTGAISVVITSFVGSDGSVQTYNINFAVGSTSPPC